MDSCLFRVKPDDERQQVIAELSERGLDPSPSSIKASWSAA